MLGNIDWKQWTGERAGEQAQTTYENYTKIKGFEDVGYLLTSYVVSGGVVTKNVQRNDALDVTDIVVSLNDNIMARGGTAFRTAIKNTTYYLDFSKGGDWVWGTAHTAGVMGTDYLTIASVTTDNNSNIAIITDMRGTIGGFRLKSEYGLEDYATKSQLKDIVIDVKTFGAVGDGVSNDNDAIRAANLYGFNRSQIPSVQLIPTNSMQIYIPSGIYRVKGSRVFGSPIPQGQSRPNIQPIAFKLVGDNATILWELESEDDELFYFDGSITMPQIKGVTIIPVSENQKISIGGTIFKYFQNISLGHTDATRGHYESISVWPGRATANYKFATRIKNVFHNVGNAMADQTVVKSCRFNYFQTLYMGENSEGVNWTFENCGFYAGGFIDSIYFDFTKMGDNFNVNNCSFSLNKNETLLRTRSTIESGLYAQGSFYNFNFRDNRFEVYGVAGDEWYLCDMNFGRLNMSNSSLRLASGSSVVKAKVNTYGLANINFDNITFYNVEFRFPILDPPAFTGGVSAVGALLKNCDFVTGKYIFKYTDGVTVYDLKDVLISTMLYYRSVRIEDCTIANGNGFLDFDIASSKFDMAVMRKTERTINVSLDGIAFGKTILLPPYQAIKNIKISSLPGLPNTYNKFRIYFGDRSLNNYVDVVNANPSEPKNEFMLWEGIATIFNDALNLQSITVYVLDNNTEVTGSVRSRISVTYEPLDTKIFGITTNANTIQLKEKSKIIDTGLTSGRPTTGLYVGRHYYDTSLGKPIWYSGTGWKDAAGATV